MDFKKCVIENNYQILSIKEENGDVHIYVGHKMYADSKLAFVMRDETISGFY